MGVYILTAVSSNLLVQFIQGIGPGNRDQYIPTDEPDQVFYQSLFIAVPDITEIRKKAVMGCQSLIVFLRNRKFPRSALHGDLGVVKNDTSGNALKKFESPDDSFQKSFAVLLAETEYERGAAVAKPGAKSID